MSDVDLAAFDLIVVFRPSSAEHLGFPAGVPIEYLDVDDPYGLPLEKYEAAARKIERGVRRVYVVDGIRRLAVEGPKASSHAAGIFNRAAKECEKEVAAFVAELRLPLSPKATLGQLGVSMATNSVGNPQLADLVIAVNEVWIRLKHRNDPSSDELRSGLEVIRELFRRLEAIA